MDTPKVDEITKNSVKLAWKKPSNDGGTKLLGYVVEKKTPDGEWIPVLEVGPKETSANIRDVAENEQCQFRILAKNAAGLSEPSNPTDIITVEDQPGEILILINFSIFSNYNLSN